MRPKEFLKQLVPPILTRFFRNMQGYGWSGNFPSWAEARQRCCGYEAPAILEKCRDALLRVKRGEAIYERDSMLFDHVEYSWPVLTALLNTALKGNGRLHVLDFGGSLGSSYFQCRTFLPPLDEFSWNIVEQPNFVACGKECFEDGTLRFFATPEECLAVVKPNLLLLSSVLEYLEKPYEWIERFRKLEISTIVLDLTPLWDAPDRLTVQVVPPTLYKASYPCWILNRGRVIDAFRPTHEPIAEFSAYLGGGILLGDTSFDYRGAILRKIANS